MLKNLKIPRLGINRRGVFFVRFPSTVDGEGRRRVVQQSLRTKDPESAKLRALRFCLDLATGGRPMSSPDPRDAVPYHVNVNTGEASAGNKDLFLTLARLRAEGQQATPSPGLVQPSTSLQAALPPAGDAISLETAFQLHLDEEQAAVKDAQTVNEKRTVYRDFMSVLGAATPVRDITAPLIVTRWTPVERGGSGCQNRKTTLISGFLPEYPR